MGRATVIDGGLDGFYTIEIDRGQAKLDARLDELADRLFAIDGEMATAQQEVNELAAAEQFQRDHVSTLIDAYITALQTKSGVDAAFATLKEQLGYLYLAARFTSDARRKLGRLKFEQAAIRKDRAALLNVPTTREADVWCTDLTEDATGSVATIEIPGEPTHLLIAPGGRTPAAADGKLLAREAMSGPQAYFNAAILPGWQKHMPDYRTGIISQIDAENDTATVTLTNVRSTAQTLDVNQTTVLTEVPVEYMECDAAAFDNGDEVVVQFLDRDWQLPKVVGFLNNPKTCGRIGYTFTEDGLIRGSAPDINTESLVWVGKSVAYLVPPTYTETAYFLDLTNDGWAYFDNGLQFWFASGTLTQSGDPANNLLQMTKFVCEFEIGQQIAEPGNQYGLIISLIQSSHPGGSMWMEIVLRSGLNASVLGAFDAQPTEFPVADQANVKYFTFPTMTPDAFGQYRVKVAVDFVAGKPRLKLNAQTIVTLDTSYPLSWATLGHVNFLNINDYVIYPNYIFPKPRINYWLAN